MQDWFSVAGGPDPSRGKNGTCAEGAVLGGILPYEPFVNPSNRPLRGAGK